MADKNKSGWLSSVVGNLSGLWSRSPALGEKLASSSFTETQADSDFDATEQYEDALSRFSSDKPTTSADGKCIVQLEDEDSEHSDCCGYSWNFWARVRPPRRRRGLCSSFPSKGELLGGESRGLFGTFDWIFPCGTDGKNCCFRRAKQTLPKSNGQNDHWESVCFLPFRGAILCIFTNLSFSFLMIPEMYSFFRMLFLSGKVFFLRN